MYTTNGTEYISENAGNYKMRNRIRLINELCAATNTPAELVVIVVNNDWQWNRRSNRTESERSAVKIGQTNSKTHGHSVETVWAYVKN